MYLTRRTTKELSIESVYQQSFVEWNGVCSKSGKKILTNCLTESTAASGIELESLGDIGTDHFPFCVKGTPSGAGWKLVNCAELAAEQRVEVTTARD